MAHSIFKEFLNHLNSTAKFFDVKILLDQLLIRGVIEPGEKSALDQEKSAENRAIELCLTYLPGKGKTLHMEFVQVLRGSSYNGLADFLEPRLNDSIEEDKMQQPVPLSPHIAFAEFLRYMTKNPYFDIQTYLPEMIMKGIIEPGERSTIQHKHSASGRAIELCLNVLPGKEAKLHRSFVDVLRRNKFKGMADFLEAKLDALYVDEDEGVCG